jgi:hydroxymethylbilane synthase
MLRDLLDDSDAHTCLRAERAYLRTMEGGCSIPSFALATFTDEGTLQLSGGLISLDGQQYVEETQSITDPEGAEALGVAVAENVLSRGGKAILADIRGHRESESATF